MTSRRGIVRHRVRVAALCLGFALAGPALAQEGACKADIEKLCPSAQPGGGQLAQCLRQNKDQISAACKARITRLEQDIKGIGQACENDVHAYCAGVQPGGGRIAACLKKNQDKVSAECKGKIAQVMQKK